MLETVGDIQVTEFLESFGGALEAGDVEAAAGMFQPGGYWRDLVSFTWNIKTMEGVDQIRDMLMNQLPWVRPSNWRLAEGEEVSIEDDLISAWVSFETAVGRGYGHLRLKEGRVWTLLTTMAELKGYEEPLDENRPLGAKHGVAGPHLSWKERLDKEQAELGYGVQPYTVIIGGGQGGIALGARLRQLGVPTIIVEKNDRAGDSWRKRYKSLCLHDPVWYDHLPYMQFPKNWPVYAPKDKIGDWLEMYTRIMELNYWTRSTVEHAEFDPAAKEWTVTVDRDGEKVVLRPKQLVFATGMAGKPNIPEFPGMETFKGDQHHSSQHPGPDAFAGKKVAVIGSNNSAHDICAALWENDVDVTMVQRSSTHVVRSEPLFDLGLRGLYSEEAMAKGITTEKADLIFASVPYAIAHEAQIPMYEKIREQDAEFYAGLEKAGFQLDFGPDESGLMMKYLRRGSGYYIDVGASQLVIDGRIKLKSGQVTRIVEDGLIMDDGSKLEADVIVYATGYGSMNGWVADLIDRDTADRVGKVWGLGSDTPKDPGPWEGELRNMWKPTQQEALWFQGGNLHQSRHYSQFLALQIKARMEGIETPVYGLQESHHTGRASEDEVPKPARLKQDEDLLAET